ncbi:MAG: DUF1343 domain-containing protein [Gemmatimonadetes bacterium]|nr:DUF1343 domain-containing protein [Gemmatimonadota bacterium]
MPAGLALQCRRVLWAFLAAAACTREPLPGGGAPSSPAARIVVAADVRPGIEVLLDDSLHLIEGRRVGLITNQTGISRDGTSSIDLLVAADGVELVALFAPEHGIRGTAAPGERVESGVDERTGLPIYSLYGETRKPTPEMLQGIEALLFDIQDIGVRYYTYVSTMALAMEAAGEVGIPFLVLDRPNPIGGALVQGSVLDPAYASFVGMYPIAMRHGMTAGELARLFNDEFRIDAELYVVPAAGWKRGQWLDQTGLPWVPPSPNMPSLESATHYPGTCLFEGTNLSVGRGTDAAFQQIGAPWLDGAVLAAGLNAYGLPGVRFEPVSFTPQRPEDGKFHGEAVHGVRFVTTDRERYEPTRAGVAALIEARALAGANWDWRRDHFDRLAGTPRLREAIEGGRGLEEIVVPWEEELGRFRAIRGRYLIY